MLSIRLRGLSSEGQFNKIKDDTRIFPLQSIRSSRIAEGTYGLEATITCNDVGMPKYSSLQRFMAQNYQEVDVDYSFLGMTCLVSPPTSSQDIPIDFVAVHGLGGHAVNTWTDTSSKSNPKLWIRDFIPSQFPNASVMTFGYESGIFSGSRGVIQEAATQLLNGLIAASQSSHRPLVFLAHSLGGLVVKKALDIARADEQYQPIYRRTRSIVFFGTPHRGSSKADLVNRMLFLLAFRNRHIDLLMKDSKPLFELAERFRPVLMDDNITIFTFYEQRKTKIPLLPLPWGVMVVPHQSAVLDDPREVVIPIDVCHKTICRFSTQQDDNYRMLMTKIRELLGHQRNRETIMFPAHIPRERPFVGREGVLQDIMAHLSICRYSNPLLPACAVLVGTPGIGKTSLAREAIHRLKPQYDYVFFLRAESEPKLHQDFKDVFRLLGLERGHIPQCSQDICERVIDHLTKTDKRWLIVYDNADEVPLLESCWPQEGNGSVIVTTHNRSILQPSPNILKVTISGWTEKEGADFISSTLITNDEDGSAVSRCRDLAKCFDGCPLVLRQIRAYMYENETSPQEMLEMLGDPNVNTDSKIYVSANLHVAWKPILSTLPSHSSKLLNILSLFDADRIQGDLFPFKIRLPRNKDLEFLTNAYDYCAARGGLLKYQIITMPKETGVMSIHRTVQTTRLEGLSSPDRNAAFNGALSILSNCFPRQELGNHMYASWQGCEAYLAHVLAFHKAYNQWSPDLDDYATYINIMCDATWYMWELGQYDQVLRLLDDIKMTCTNTIGPNTLEAARIFVNWGSVLSRLNRDQEAGDLFREGLRIRERHLSNNHTLVANSQMQVANSYAAQGRADQAIAGHLRVIEIRMQSSGTPPELMIISYLNLCRSLLMAKKIDQAEQYLNQAEKIERDLEDTSSKLVYEHERLYILGNIQIARANFRAALETHRAAYQVWNLIQGTSLKLAASLHKMGVLYCELGDFGKAVEQLLINRRSELLEEAVELLNSEAGAITGRISRLARTEMTLAQITRGYIANDWRRKAQAHYCEAAGCKKEEIDWSEADFDLLVPLIER